MSDHKKTLYNCAIDGQGYLLSNTPERPARQMVQAPIYGNRFASGDRNYTDFTFWWFWAQTDWSGGFKDSVSWQDDARFYYSTNLDVFSQIGSVKLASGLIEKEDFAEDIYCGDFGAVGGTDYYFIGTDDDAAGKPVVYRSSDGTTFTNISDGNIGTNQSTIGYVKVISSVLWVGTRGTTQANDIVFSYDGSAWTDHSSAIKAALTGTPNILASSAIAQVSSDIYVAVEDGLNDKVAIAKYDGSSWSQIALWTDGTTIFDMINYLGDVFYLKGDSGATVELRYWDTSSSTDVLVYEFKNDFYNNNRGANKYLHILGGVLIVTVPRKEIWSYDRIEMRRIWKRDDEKYDIGREAVGWTEQGGIYHDNKVFWGNLIYDGTSFFNYKKDSGDANVFLLPVLSDGTNLWWKSSTDATKLYADGNYKGTADKNFLIFSQLDSVSTIEKLFYSSTIYFKKLASGQKITIKYSDDEMASWTSLGTADYSVDGGTITDKTFYFAENTSAKKVWIKLELEAGGSNTPVFQDISIAYMPLPEYRQRWSVGVQCYDNLMLLDGKTRESKRGEELRNLLKTVWKNKDVVEFQDVDFSETLLNGSLTASNTTITVDSTNRFPEQGIIRIENEKVKYTGKTATTFTDCTRKYEGTIAAAHADNTVVSNSHNVIITNYEERTPIGAKTRIEEYLVSLEMQEV